MEVGVYNTPGDASGVYVAGDYAYIVDVDELLSFLRRPAEAPEVLGRPVGE